MKLELRLKIVHINQYYNIFGGAEKYLLDICSYLEKLGHEIIVIASAENSAKNFDGRKVYLINNSYGIRSSLKLFGKLWKILKYENPDIIHLHNTRLFLSPFFLRHLVKKKTVVKTIHDVSILCPKTRFKVLRKTDELCNSPMGFRCFKDGCALSSNKQNSLFWNLHKFFFAFLDIRNARRIAKILVSSSYVYNELINNGFKSRNISIQPLFTDKNLIQENCSTFDDRKHTILYVGRLDSSKGIMQFIEGLSLLELTNWQAEIIGEGEIRKYSEELVRQLGMDGKIRFFGKLSGDELDSHYSRCTLLVMPSMIPESFGLVGIEAMAFGKPVVAYDSGGINEWLMDNETGFIVKRGDIRGLVNKISQILTDRQLAEKMGKRGMDRVQKYYRHDQYMKKLISTYEDAIRIKGN